MNENDSSQNYQDTLLLHYWYILRKRRNTVLLFLGIFLATVLVASLNATAYYSSTAVVQISPKEPVVYELDEVSEMVSATGHKDMRIYYATQYRIIQSRAVLEEAIRRLQEEYGITDFDEVPNPYEYMRNHLEVRPEEDTYLVQITFEHPDPDTAALFANTVAQTYIDYNLDKAMRATQEALEYLRTQQEEFDQKRRNSDIKVHEFKYANNLAGLSKEENATMENLERLRSEWSLTHTRRVQVQAMVRELVRISRSETWGGLANHLADDNEVIRNLLKHYQSLQQERAVLVARYKEKHPSIVRVDAELQGLEDQVRAQVDSIIGAYRAELAILDRRESALEQELSEVMDQVEALDEKLIELRALQAEADRNESFFRSIDTRLSEVDLSQVIRANNVHFVDRAIPTEEPVRPRILVNMAMALAVGSLGGCAMAFFAEYLDATVKSREDVENVVGMPYLGVVPLQSPSAIEELEAPRDRGIVVHARPRSTVAETLRTIRTNILFRTGGAQKKHRRLLITSAAPREGKTFISANLSAIMAMAGSRVLLIDSDLRRPYIHKIFDVENAYGLSNALAGQLEPEDAVRPSHVPDLWLMLAGPHPPNPAELLESGKMEEVLEQLRDYDVIVLDSPPVNAVTDPLILSTMTDGVIFVVETNQTKRALVRNARTRLVEMKANIIGAVVNKLDVRRSGYGYYYYYYYENYPYYYGESGQQAPSSGSDPTRRSDSA